MRAVPGYAAANAQGETHNLTGSQVESIAIMHRLAASVRRFLIVYQGFEKKRA
jgi:hypothetical protein